MSMPNVADNGDPISAAIDAAEEVRDPLDDSWRRRRPIPAPRSCRRCWSGSQRLGGTIAPRSSPSGRS